MEIKTKDPAQGAATDGAEWRYEHCPGPDDDRGVGCDLVAPDGTVLASCLWASGELDIDSDGCGVFAAGLAAVDIDWPSEEEAMDAVWEDDEDDEDDEGAMTYHVFD